MPEQIKKWITANGRHIPLDDKGNPITETGKKTLGTETGDNVKESGGVKYSKTFAEYKKEYGGDSFEAARAFFKNELHGKSVRCKTNDGEQEAFFTSKSWGKLKYDMKNDPLKAEILPLIPDILTTGEYSFRELHKERKDNISSFYTYHKIVQTSEGGKDAIVDVAVRPSHPIKYGVYNLTREGSYNYQKRKEYQEIENASAAHPGLSPRGAKAGNDSVVKDSITHILEVVSIRFADEGEEKEVKDDMPRDKPLSDRIAFDAQSSRRHKDGNGYLRIDASNITKEQVAPYYGYEVPGCERLGLEPNRLYYMYRPADELAKAAGSFDGMPLLFEHHETNVRRRHRK